MTPRVTIAIPFFNAEATLIDAVKSVFAQTYDDWELLLLDDGSEDQSLQVAESVHDKRVRVYGDGTNKGLVFRLNQISQLAAGEFLARMDADDLMHPERIARQVLYLDAHQEIDVVDTGLFSINENNLVCGVRRAEKCDQSPASVMRNGLLHHPTIMARAMWVRKNPYDPEYVRAEDRELWCRTCGSSRFARIADPLYFYRESTSVSPNNYLQSARTDRKIILRYGPQMVGARSAAVLFTQSLLKSIIYRTFHACGMQHVLIRKRSGALTEAQRVEASASLAQVLLTEVPLVNSTIGGSATVVATNV